MRRYLGLVLAALLGCSAWFVLRDEERASRTERTSASAAEQDAAELAAPVLAAARVAREVSATEGAPVGDSGSEESQEEDEDPPTPAAPGPQQALLRVRAVALESGQPLAGVSLGLQPLDFEEEHEWRNSTQADPARGVENDEVLTRVDGRGEFIVETGFGYGLYGHGENGLADEAELELGTFAPGETREVTLALATRWTREWVGRVVDFDSELPLVGVEVVVGVARKTLVEGFVPLAQGTSGADGRVRLVLPAWQSAVARCRLGGYALGGAWVSRVRVPDEDDVEEEGEIEIEEVVEEPIEEAPQLLHLHRLAALTLVVLESDGSPVAGVEAELRQQSWDLVENGGFDLEDVVWTRSSDASGTCSFEELPSGCELPVSLRREGRALAWTNGDPLVLLPGESRRFEWRLPAKSRIEGRIVDPHGAPLAEVAINVAYAGSWGQNPPPALQEWQFPRDSLAIGASERTFRAEARTDADGRFAVSEVPIGAYFVGAADDGDVPALGKIVVVREGAAAVVELVLERGLWIEGKLLDPRGEPAADVGLSCFGADDSNRWCRASTAAEEDGSFVLGPLLSGSYRLSSRGGEGDHDACIEELVVEAGTTGLELALRLGGTISVVLEGLAEDEDGDVRVLAEGADWPGWMQQLPPGRYDLVGTSPSGLAGVLRGFVVEPGRDHEVTLALAPGATVQLAEPPEGTDISSFLVRVDGVAITAPSFEHSAPLVVPPGHVRVEARGWSLVTLKLETLATRERDLAAGETWTVDFAH